MHTSVLYTDNSEKKKEGTEYRFISQLEILDSINIIQHFRL